MNNTLIENETLSTTALPFSGFLDALTIYYINVIQNILNYSTSITSFLAFLAGIINISVFVQMDLKQGVNQSLLVLSCSDCAIGLAAIAVKIIYFMSLYQLDIAGQATAKILIQALRIVANFPICVSLVVTTIIAVVRCMCVVMPIAFRNTVTNRRQLMAIGVSSCVALIFSLPYLVDFLNHVTHKNTLPMSTTGSLKLTKGFLQISVNMLFSACLIIMALCMGFLFHALRRFSKFKALATSRKYGDSSNVSSQFSAREAQVVKTTFVVLATFFVCNVPMCIHALLSLFYKNFQHYRLEFNVTQMIVAVFSTLKASLNTLAYYFTNTAFRIVIKSHFAKCFKSH